MKARSVEGLEAATPFRQAAARLLATRLAELEGLAESALVPDAGGAQHDMRIAAKRLRYLLEVAAPCLQGPGVDELRERATELQGALGEVHDCDVMLGRARGIDSLEALLRARRAVAFRRFAELWRETAPATPNPAG